MPLTHGVLLLHIEAEAVPRIIMIASDSSASSREHEPDREGENDVPCNEGRKANVKDKIESEDNTAMSMSPIQALQSFV